MVLVRDPTPTPCYDGGFVVAPETLPVLDGAVYDYEYLQHPQPVLVEECMGMGSHPWELPAGVSPSSSPSSVFTFDGHGEECWPASAWIHDTDQLSCGQAARHAAGSATPANCLSFGGGSRNCAAATASKKRPRAPAPSRQGAEQEAAAVTKKRCGGGRTGTKPAMAPTATPPKGPQSLAAKNRSERISEKLKALQELVPNGGKVDMVTMLDKAITYVKFMQLQLKVLETDAFCPTQGGKAPEMSQVKQALDAILLSSSLPQRNHH